jgi:hypothetical protein
MHHTKGTIYRSHNKTTDSLGGKGLLATIPMRKPSLRASKFIQTTPIERNPQNYYLSNIPGGVQASASNHLIDPH